MTIFNVSNATQLQSALDQAIGGDRIILAGGNYGTVTINNRSYATNITIQSAGSFNRAHFDGLNVFNSKNIFFSGLDLGRALKPGEIPEWVTLNRIQDSSNIRLMNSIIHGSQDGDPTNDGQGLVVRDTNNFWLTGNTFDDLYRGSFIQRGSNHVVSNNLYKNMRVDGATFAAVDRTTVDGNTFRDFHWIDGDHPDAIQFWNTNETRGSTNVTIKNNVVLPGQGMGTQGIWIADPGAYGFKNFVIENNLLYSNEMYNGIGIVGGSGFQVIGNTILSSPTDSKQFWIRLQNSNDILVKNNVADNIVQVSGVTGLTEVDNLVLARTPSAKALVSQLEKPLTVQDLIVDGYGYQMPITYKAMDIAVKPIAEADVSQGMAAALKGLIGQSEPETLELPSTMVSGPAALHPAAVVPDVSGGDLAGFVPDIGDRLTAFTSLHFGFA